ncbi:hypothetical protein AVEN_270183-1, partial [Araneus ventricosus]
MSSNLNRVNPSLSWHPRFLNDSRCYSSSTEDRILIVITDHGPTPPNGKREPAYLSYGFSSVYSRCSPVGEICQGTQAHGPDIALLIFGDHRQQQQHERIGVVMKRCIN